MHTAWLLVVLAAHFVFRIRAKADYFCAHDSRATWASLGRLCFVGHRLRHIQTQTMYLSKQPSCSRWLMV